MSTDRLSAFVRSGIALLSEAMFLRAPQGLLRHQPPVPVVTQGFDLPLLFLWQFQQTEPLGDPVRGDSVHLPELNPCEFVADHLGLEFPGEDEWVTVGASAGFGNVWTEGCEGENGPGSGSSHPRFGVPKTPFERKTEKGSLSTPLPSFMGRSILSEPREWKLRVQCWKASRSTLPMQGPNRFHHGRPSNGNGNRPAGFPVPAFSQGVLCCRRH